MTNTAQGGVRVCALCAGTGHQFVMRSWFTADGVNRIRCAICAGSGISEYRPAAGYVASQRRLRARALASDDTEREVG